MEGQQGQGIRLELGIPVCRRRGFTKFRYKEAKRKDAATADRDWRLNGQGLEWRDGGGVDVTDGWGMETEGTTEARAGGGDQRLSRLPQVDERRDGHGLENGV